MAENLQKEHDEKTNFIEKKNVIETVAVDRLDLEILKKESQAYQLVVQIQRGEQALAQVQSEINSLYEMRQTRVPANVGNEEEAKEKSASA